MIRLDDEPETPDQPDVPEPMGPDVKEPGDNRTLNSPINELEKPAVQAAQGADLRRDQRQGGARRHRPPAGAGRRVSDPIDVYVNSPGGHVESGDTIHDMIRFVDAEAPVRMIGTGWVASAGALIFLAGRKERRLLPAEHPVPAAPADGRRARPGDRHRHRGARDHQDARAAQPPDRARDRPDYEKVAKDTDRNYWMSAEEAIAYGLVSRVVNSAKDF